MSSLKEVKWSFREGYDLIIIFGKWNFMKFYMFLMKWSENWWSPTPYTGVVKKKIYWILYKVNRCKYSKLGSLQTSSFFFSGHSHPRPPSPTLESWGYTGFEISFNFTKTSSNFTNFVPELYKVSPESSWTSRDPLMKSKSWKTRLFLFPLFFYVFKKRLSYHPEPCPSVELIMIKW
jgi:hypothetical protein